MQTFADSSWIRKRFKTFPDSVHTSILEIVSDWGQSSMKTEQNESVIQNGEFFCGFIWKRKRLISFLM